MYTCQRDLITPSRNAAASITYPITYAFPLHLSPTAYPTAPPLLLSTERSTIIIIIIDVNSSFLRTYASEHFLVSFIYYTYTVCPLRSIWPPESGLSE